MGLARHGVLDAIFREFSPDERGRVFVRRWIVLQVLNVAVLVSFLHLTAADSKGDSLFVANVLLEEVDFDFVVGW